HPGRRAEAGAVRIVRPEGPAHGGTAHGGTGPAAAPVRVRHAVRALARGTRPVDRRGGRHSAERTRRRGGGASPHHPRCPQGAARRGDTAPGGGRVPTPRAVYTRHRPTSRCAARSI